MTFAEIILRIGTAIGGWLIFLGHTLTLSVIAQADCDPASDELWRGTLLFALVSAIGLFFAGRGLQWARSLRWVALPAIVLALLATRTVVPGLLTTTLGDASLCDIAVATAPVAAGHVPTSIERLWPVVQTLVLIFGVVQGVRYWRAASAAAPPSDG